MRNTWIICPLVENNSPKGLLMLHVTTESPGLVGKKGARKGLLLEDESASHQLVGGVIDHQGFDG